jgi:threonine synthase
MRVICHDCQEEKEFDPRVFRCTCGGAWEPVENGEFTYDSIKKDISSLWRYKDIFGLKTLELPVSLGAGWTPLLSSEWEGNDAFFKLEYFSPTGSFKDRGTEVEMNYLKAVGVEQVVEDSSGNAGAAMAAYAARMGIRADIFAPDSASPAKLSQIQVYGAELHKIPGPRIEATRAVLKAVDGGAVYASHAYNPVYLLGQQSVAWEIWEQTGGKLPDAVIIPVGQGGLLMGAWLGFRRLFLAGVIEKLPRLYAAQPECLAPIYHAFTNGLDDIPVTHPAQQSIAKGLAIIKPVRGKRIMQALRESRGGAVVVSEDQIRQAYHKLAKRGFFAEPSSAVAVAAICAVRQELGKRAVILTALTGSGLKTPVLED